MDTLLFWLALFIALLSVVSLYRIVAGPNLFDRILGAGLLSTNVVLLLVVIGFVVERVDMFVDLAIAYALLNFISVIALGKYFEIRREGSR